MVEELCGVEALECLAHEQIFPCELDFDDWLRRGTDDDATRRVVEGSLAERPAATDCFAVDEHDGRRVLTPRLWLGRWRSQ